MILIDAGGTASLLNKLQGMQREIYLSLDTSRETFSYLSTSELLFDLRLRENIIKAAIDLNESEVTFRTFEQSSFNPHYWVKGSYGYLLRPDVLPSDAIRDIFTNGKMYGFECSTAMVIVYYKAVVESIQESAFNYLFNGLLVWNWNADPDLAIITRLGTEYVLGDVVYFNNPDFKYPVWRGVNAVLLGNDRYYGHGVGIQSANEMIETLKTLRKEGATTIPYMLNQHSRLNYRYLYRYSKRQGYHHYSWREEESAFD